LHTFVPEVVLGGVICIVLAIGPKVRGLKPSRERWLFNGEKIRSMTSFGGEVKPSSPGRKILQNVKYSLKYDRYTKVLRQNSADIARKFLPASLLGVSAATRADSTVDHKNGRSCVGSFVRYHPVIVTTRFVQ
jgi:hypothetical protein